MHCQEVVLQLMFRSGIGRALSYLSRTQAKSQPYLLKPKLRKMETSNTKPLVWIDCEMTGLDHVNDEIIEICCIVTDGKLKNLDTETKEQCYESVVHCPKEKLDAMDQWCLDHHGSSGLMDKVLASKKTKEQVEEELLNYLQKWIPEKRVGILAGNSVHMDRLFMLKDFPRVVQYLHYRIVDVSSIMEVARRHNPSLTAVVPKKEAAHTAKSDILESISQLQWYMDHYLKSEEETKEFVESQNEKRPSEEPIDQPQKKQCQ